MQPGAAMQILMQVADHHLARMRTSESGELNVHDSGISQEDLETATAVITAMLNTMLPVARFRCFVEVPNEAGAQKGQNTLGEVRADFAVTAISMAGIKSGLSGLYKHDLDVRILVFEQFATGAEVVTGFQGEIQSQQFREWYRTLEEQVRAPEVQPS